MANLALDGPEVLADPPSVSGLRVVSAHESGPAGGDETQDPLVADISACVARLRDHIYRLNLGSLLVEAGCDLFDLGAKDD